jgi:hypothetical protein
MTCMIEYPTLIVRLLIQIFIDEFFGKFLLICLKFQNIFSLNLVNTEKILKILVSYNQLNMSKAENVI